MTVTAESPANGCSVTRERVTWTRWDAQLMRNRTSHPWQYVVTEPDGCQRFFDTRPEADEWIAGAPTGS